MKKVLLCILFTLVVFTTSCEDENLPSPQNTPENTQSEGDDAEDPIIEDD